MNQFIRNILLCVILLNLECRAQDSNMPCFCIKLADCPSLMEKLSLRPDPKHVDHLRSKSCGFDDLEPKVCCPEIPRRRFERSVLSSGKVPFGNHESEDYPNDEEEIMREKLLPDETCGISVDERFLNGKNVKIGAYRWIARLRYTRPDISGFLYRCEGALINTKYVLTAAHCITDLPNQLKLLSIRLGSNPPQDFLPLRVIAHSKYNKPKYKNDIGLIRLDGEAIIATLTYEYNPILQDVQLKIADIDECKYNYSTRFQIDIDSTQICTRGPEGKDTCEDDSAGLLMRVEQLTKYKYDIPRYFLIGITSFGPKWCGNENLPGVYTRVSNYLEWILSHMEDD